MKKLLAFLIAFSTVFLSGCVQKDLIDIYVFSERFSKHSENFEIDTDNLTAQEEESILRFPLTFNDKFLLCVNVNDDTSLITSFSVTYMFDKKRALSDEDFSSFLEISDSAVKGFTDLQNTDEIFSGISLRKKSDVLKDNHTSFKHGFYEYSFVSNEIGFYFTASTDRR